MTTTLLRLSGAVAETAQAAPPESEGSGPLWMVAAGLTLVLFLVGLAQVGYRLRTHKPLPLIFVVAVLVLGVAAAVLVPRAVL